VHATWLRWAVPFRALALFPTPASEVVAGFIITGVRKPAQTEKDPRAGATLPVSLQ
jgi:hypothetical protein